MSLSPQSPLSLDQAAKLCLNGLVKASTLRAAAARGDLQTERLGRRIVTTPADVEAWRKLCRDREKARVSTYVQPVEMAMAQLSKTPDGSSETGAAQLAQAAALEKARKLKESSKPISPRNIRRPGASVHLLKSASPT